MARIPLNDLQLEILTWIRDGTPDGVYEDYRPRIVARALHNRGLVDVSGYGKNWRATLTTGGAHYLEHGDYPPSDDDPAATSAPRPRSTVRTKPAPASKAAAERKPRKPQRVGPTDAMMNALAAAEDHRIEIEYDQVQRYRQLALTAERFKKIPDGMQVTVSSDYRTRTAHVTLEPLPEWRTRTLDRIPVPGALRGPSDVIKALRTRDDLDIRTAEKNRALRLVEALVVEARHRKYTVTAIPAPRKDRWGYVQRTEENTGHIKIMLGPDEYRLSIYQLTEKIEHVATKSELARAGRGYALPKWDYIPTGRLGIRIDNRGGTFWGDSWTDRDDRPLDDALAQILQELELRHDAAVDRRLAEEGRRLERKRQWEVARENAIQQLADSHRADILRDQIARAHEVAAIRDYVVQLQQHADKELEGGARADALAWVEWARAYADRIDPLRDRVGLPEPPGSTPSNLAPFMGGWNPYGPS